MLAQDSCSSKLAFGGIFSVPIAQMVADHKRAMAFLPGPENVMNFLS
jgi:hypothetical protein